MLDPVSVVTVQQFDIKTFFHNVTGRWKQCIVTLA